MKAFININSEESKVINMAEADRTKALLFYLSNNRDFVQAKTIASLLHVSKKNGLSLD